VTSPIGLATVDYTILITDRDLDYIGDPIVCWTYIDVTLRFNEPGTGLFTVPAFPWIIEQISAGRRAVLIRNGEQLISGPIEKWMHERSNDGENAGVGRLTINFSDDLASIAARMAYPNTTQTIEGQTSDNWLWTGAAEAGVLRIVRENAGTLALPERQIPHLLVATAVGIGTSVTVTAQRMQPVLDVARSMAEIGGNFGFRTRQTNANNILFETYEPDDKSNSVRFGFGLGNLAYIAYEVSAPTATTVAVGGQGETGAAAFMAERQNTVEESSWGRFEKLVARSGELDPAELADEGDQALAEGASTTRLASNTLDIPDQRFGVNYNVGDLVAVESWPGEEVVDLVRTVHLQVYPTSGEYVSATVGSQAASADPFWVQRMREVEDRIGQLERTVLPA
jgi:hypothetical protein